MTIVTFITYLYYTVKNLGFFSLLHNRGEYKFKNII